LLEVNIARRTSDARAASLGVKPRPLSPALERQAPGRDNANTTPAAGKTKEAGCAAKKLVSFCLDKFVTLLPLPRQLEHIGKKMIPKICRASSW
jgi:hypothetical protein